MELSDYQNKRKNNQRGKLEEVKEQALAHIALYQLHSKMAHQYQIPGIPHSYYSTVTH